MCFLMFFPLWKTEGPRGRELSVLLGEGAGSAPGWCPASPCQAGGPDPVNGRPRFPLPGCDCGMGTGVPSAPSCVALGKSPYLSELQCL